MRITLAPLLLPAAAAGLCAAFVPLDGWEPVSTRLITALGVLGAAVLVRLARGLSVPSGDGLALDEARKVAMAIKLMMRKLRALIFVILATMLLLITLPSAELKIAAQFHPAWLYAEILRRVCSGLIGLSLAYSFVRMTQVIASDIGLVDIQADVLLTSLARKESKKFEDQKANSTVAPFKAPEGYGKKIS